MIDAEDILTLPNQAPLNVLPEAAAPGAAWFQLNEADFGAEDVLNLADELPGLQPLPQPSEFQFQATLPLRCTAPLSEVFALTDYANLDQFGFTSHGEIVGLPPPHTLYETLALAPPAQFEESSLAAELAARLGTVETPAETTVETEKHVVFELAGARYAVPMEQVLEVCEFEQITPVFNMPEWVMGITNLRGDIISVVDLRQLLASSAEPAARRPPLRNLLVVQTQRGDLTTCLAVESMQGLAQAPAAEIQQVERVHGDGLTPYTRGFFAQGDDLLSMLNLESLLRSLEITG